MENLGIDVKILISQLINFGIFFLIFKKFVATPFIAIMQDEKKKKEEGETMAKEVESKRSALAKEEETAREDVKQKTLISLSAAKESAEKERLLLLKKAQTEAEEIVKKGRQKMEEERLAMEKEYKQKMAKESVETVENALKDFLSDDMQKKVNEHILTQLHN